MRSISSLSSSPSSTSLSSSLLSSLSSSYIIALSRFFVDLLLHMRIQKIETPQREVLKK